MMSSWASKWCCPNQSSESSWGAMLLGVAFGGVVGYLMGCNKEGVEGVVQQAGEKLQDVKSNVSNMMSSKGQGGGSQSEGSGSSSMGTSGSSSSGSSGTSGSSRSGSSSSGTSGSGHGGSSSSTSGI